jgi:hypothetical protein
MQGALMQSPELSLAGKLDNGLTKGLCLLLRGLRTGSLWLLGLLTLAGLPLMIFEYGEGLADLSLLEWGVMPLLALLLWRHIHYCQHFTTGTWRGLSRLLMFQGVMSVLGMIIIGLFTFVMAQTEDIQRLYQYLLQDDPISKIVTFGSVLLAVYLAAPTATTESLSTPEAMPARVEPSVSTTAKEASL